MRSLDFGQLVEDLLPLHAGQALELQFDDRLGLPLGEIERGPSGRTATSCSRPLGNRQQRP